MISQSLKSGRKLVKFGDVVRNANLSVRDPGAAGIERIVGLEHLDPENLHVRRWNTVENGTSFTRKFVPGQTLFGKRRAYQRKVAFAEFEGICSGDILTFEPKDPDVLLPELLPFICQTDAFFDHALGTSAGSLSPRTSYKALRDFEFPLPPIEEQKRIAEILWAADEAVETSLLIQNSLDNLLGAHLLHFFPKKDRPILKDDMDMQLQEFCSESITYGIVQAGEHIPAGVPYIRVSDMVEGDLSLDGMLRTSPEIAARFKRSKVTEGDIVFALRGVLGMVKVVPSELEGANLTQGTARIAVEDSYNRDYVLWALRSTRIRRQIEIEAKGSTFKEITLQALKKIWIPMRTLPEQYVISKVLNEVRERIDLASAHADENKSLYRDLLKVSIGSPGV